MTEELLHQTNTVIASEFLAAGELARRGFNVTLTFKTQRKETSNEP